MARFREMRKRANIGLSGAASALGVSKQAVNAWERGKNLPRADMLMKTAALYGCTADDLLAPESEAAQ